ncbi:MAG: DUF2922 domain-containing protein [Acidaminococcaceae bacterium]|nr:DUF2922 domain-containing protein [Acidaminococcaceae bacterium]
MSKSLQMVFKDTAGKTKSINLDDPREDLTKAEVSEVMEGLITDKALVTTNGDLAEVSAIRVSSVEDLA